MSAENSAYIEPSSLGDLYLAANRIADRPGLIEDFVDSYGIHEMHLAALEGGYYNLAEEAQTTGTFATAVRLGRIRLKNPDWQPPALDTQRLSDLCDMAEQQHTRWIKSAAGERYLREQYENGVLAKHPKE